LLDSRGKPMDQAFSCSFPFSLARVLAFSRSPHMESTSQFGSLPTKLTLRQKLSLALLNYAYVGMAQPEGYRAPVQVYLVRCIRHNRLYLDTPHGFNENFICDLCQEEFFRIYGGEEKCVV
jgi:hypothetical protein